MSPRLGVEVTHNPVDAATVNLSACNHDDHLCCYSASPKPYFWLHDHLTQHQGKNTMGYQVGMWQNSPFKPQEKGGEMAHKTIDD